VPDPPEPLLVLLLGALGAGLLTGFAVLLFEQMVAGVEWLAFGWHADEWTDAHVAILLIVPIAGGLVAGVLMHLSGIRHEPGHGVTEVIESAAIDFEELPWTKVPAKASAAAISLGSGASLGPEDPAVEIGGGIGEAVARVSRRSHAAMRNMVAAGGACGLSAAFNAPLAAVVFAVEVFRVRPFSRSALIVVAASVAAFLPAVVYSPDPPFHAPVPELPLGPGMLLGLVIGVVAGAASAAHIRLSYAVEHRFLHWHAPPRWLKPAIGGAMLAAGALLMPALLGVGYDTLEEVLSGDVTTLQLLIALAVGKALLVAVSFGSGMLGGMFAPSFFIGAPLGAAMTLVGGALVPDLAAQAGSFAVIGMAAMLAGVVHAPITAVLVTRAIAGSWSVLPLLAPACLASYAVARLLHKGSIYTHHVREDMHGREE
jgi:chloride channel protein, CIC family